MISSEIDIGYAKSHRILDILVREKVLKPFDGVYMKDLSKQSDKVVLKEIKKVLKKEKDAKPFYFQWKFNLEYDRAEKLLNKSRSSENWFVITLGVLFESIPGIALILTPVISALLVLKHKIDLIEGILISVFFVFIIYKIWRNN